MNNKEKRKFYQEKFILEEFLKVNPIVPLETLQERQNILGETDFTFNVNGKRIGIELRALVNDRTQKKDSFIEKILSSAERRYTSMKLPTITLYVYLKEHGIKNKENAKTVENSILQTAINSLSELKNADNRCLKLDIKPQNDLIYNIHAIYKADLNVGPKRWFLISSCSIQDNPYSLIQEAITCKNNKYNSYNKSEIEYDEIYLLIHLPTGRKAGGFEFTKDVNNQTFVSSFNQTFLFDNIMRESYTLNTTNNNPKPA